jgi:3-oxoacyl-[acyl-carrier-protein] synthase-1
MSSTASATLATWFKIHGVNYSISSACSTSAHCIGNAYELIQWGKQDRMFAGGAEELDWTMSVLFDAMGAMSSKYNDTPTTASRTYDATRDGFVIAGGGGVVVLEELSHALARGAKIYGEVTGYGATSDGHDMVAPSGEGGERSMRLALSTLPQGRHIDYINSHGTSTVVGDVTEMEAIRRVFGRGQTPPTASTKSRDDTGPVGLVTQWSSAKTASLSASPGGASTTVLEIPLMLVSVKQLILLSLISTLYLELHRSKGL